MQRTLVIGLLPTDSDAEIALNNLAEAEFKPSSISVATSDPRRTAALTDTPGALGKLAPDQAAARLQALGAAAEDCQRWQAGLAGGGVLVTVVTPPDAAAAAEEILANQKATQTRALRLRPQPRRTAS